MGKTEKRSWKIFFELGKSRLKSKEYYLAVKEFSKSIIFKNTANNYEIASSYLYRGNAHYYLKNLDKANDDLKKSYNQVKKELRNYSKDLIKKKELIVLNKIDLLDKDIVKKTVKNFSKDKNCEVLTLSTLEKDSISKIKAKLISYVS